MSAAVAGVRRRPGARVQAGWLLAAAGCVLVAGAGAAWALSSTQLRHLAMPVVMDPSSPRRAPLPLLQGATCATEVLAQLPGRVSALAEEEGGTLWIGGFDTGVFRLEKGAPAPERISGLRGRELFVNALALFEGRVYAGTAGGLVEVDANGAKTIAGGAAVQALLPTEGALWVGTSHGLRVMGPDGALDDPHVVDASGAPLRVNALAQSGGRIWVGTPRGVWSFVGSGDDVRWHPLVFGASAAESNVVVALAPVGEGVIASTDNAGVVLVRPEGDPVALRFDRATANLGNPGAAVPFAHMGVFGTQGGGLVFASPRRSQLRAFGATEGVEDLSALAAGSRLFGGTAAGEVVTLECTPSP